MDFENETPLPALLLRNAEDGDFITALVVAAATFVLGEDELSLAREQLPLAVTRPDSLAGDAHFDKSGVSVCATGFVYAPKGEARSADATLLVGETSIRVRAFGVRVWQQSLLGDRLTPTSPLPFQRVPMRWEKAFGGTVSRPAGVVSLDGEDVIVPPHDEAFAQNPIGAGYYADRRSAVDQPLPQLEDPESLIQSPNDRPEPVCFAPYSLGGALRTAFVMRDGVPDPTLAGRMFSRAAPRTTFEKLDPGTRVELGGMRPGGELLGFAVPAPPCAVEVELEGRTAPVSLRVDALDIDAEAALLRVVYRARFRYGLVQHERRRTRLLPAGKLVPLQPLQLSA
ncbi:MAG: DUF2169 domain-containing protein [Byssovorax sp.]